MVSIPIAVKSQVDIELSLLAETDIISPADNVKPREHTIVSPLVIGFSKNKAVVTRTINLAL